MKTRNHGRLALVFRVETLPMGGMDAAPEWIELGDFERLIDYRTFVFSPRGQHRERLGASVRVDVIPVDPLGDGHAKRESAPPEAEPETASRWYAMLRVLHAKHVRAKTLHHHDFFKWVVDLYVDGHSLTKILREKGYIA